MNCMQHPIEFGRLQEHGSFSISIGYQAILLNIQLFHHPYRWVLKVPLLLTYVDNVTGGYSVLQGSTVCQCWENEWESSKE